MPEEIQNRPIAQSYIKLRSIPIGTTLLREGKISAGTVSVSIRAQGVEAIEGTLSNNGVLSGMARLYALLNLKEGDQISFVITGSTSLEVIPTQNVLPVPIDQGYKSVFETQGLKHIQIEIFRPQNLQFWDPQTEADVYMAFGVLQEYTDYIYCCGASQTILTRLGYTSNTKPDAIVCHRTNQEYHMAEFKPSSSKFKLNHRPEEIDVLICWKDDENDRAVLPKHIIELYDVARTAAKAEIEDE